MKQIFKLLCLTISITLQHNCYSYAFSGKDKVKLEVKSIGYSPLEYDSTLIDIYNDANNAFIECVLNDFNDLGVIRVQYLPLVLKYQNPSSERIKDVCLKFNLDAYLVTKLQFAIEEKIINSKKEVYINPKKTVISMKLFNAEGRNIDSAIYNSDKFIKFVKDLGDNNAIQESVSFVVKKLSKNIKFQSPDFRIEQITQQIWQSYKLFGKDKYYKSITPSGRLNLCLYNNSGYFLEPTPDSSKMIPGDKFVYKSNNKEIILHSKIENLSFKVIGFNQNVLILRPEVKSNIDKIYFRRLSIAEVSAILKSQKEIHENLTHIRDSLGGHKNRLDTSYNPDEEVYFVVEQSASFQGGDLNDFRDYIFKHTIYPNEAEIKKMTGKAIVQFLIGRDGYIKDIKIIRSSGYELLDKEAIRVLSSSPQWKPGRQGGKNVNQLFTMPVSFVIK